jgi:hypothetical protein
MATRPPLDSAPRPSLGSPCPPPLTSDTDGLSPSAGGSQGGAPTREGCRSPGGAVLEDVLLSLERNAFELGLTGDLGTWITAWARVGFAYKSEGDAASAKRCEDNAVQLRAFQRAAARAAAAAS